MADYDGRDDGSHAIDIPDPVRGFYRSLSRHLSSRNIYALHQLYESDFPKLSERYYSDSSWPTPEQMADSVGEEDDGGGQGGGVRSSASLLYRDLYYRHIYSKLTVDVEDRVESFHAFMELFHALLSMSNDALLQAQRDKGDGRDRKGGKKGQQHHQQRSGRDDEGGDDSVFELPVNWTWDLVEEFVYQFESFHLFRARANKLSQEEAQTIADNPDVWNGHTVLRYLHAMVRKAGIDINVSAAAAASTSSAPVASFFNTLGYFALVGLLRVHVLLCDYSSALQVLTPVDLRQHKTLLASVPACYLTLYYYLGYSYLMLHRYVDALRIFSYFLVYRTRNKHVQHKVQSTPTMASKLDKLQGLLALAYAISPDLVDDAIVSELKDKYGERWARLQRMDMVVYEDVFFTCSPKCVVLTAVQPSSPLAQSPHELRQQQWAVFSQDVVERARLPALISYLKLFSSVSVAKLSAHLGLNEDDTLALLMMSGMKAEQERWVGGSAADGRRVAVVDTEMRLDGERVEMNKEQSTRKYGDFFVRQIARLEEIQRVSHTTQHTPHAHSSSGPPNRSFVTQLIVPSSCAASQEVLATASAK